MLADPTETSATELASSTHISSPLLPLASGCNPNPEYAMHGRIIVLALPHPTASTIRIRIAAELRKIRFLALSAPLPSPRRRT
jgi:hypothetical protein